MLLSPFTPLKLPNGQVIKNRLVKAAMEENLGDAELKPSSELVHLYRQWMRGGVGAMITGNVMVDHLAMTGPGGIALEADSELEMFREWSSVVDKGECKIIMQINHPGRQVYKRQGGKALAPSAIPLDMGKHSNLFAEPVAMTEADIEDIIKRFVQTSKQAQKAGFNGVQVHAAHGYLLNQFLSPKTNQRQDNWGGGIENRARLLLTIIKQIRQAVGADFIVAVKLNSADFQRGGFSCDDAAEVINMLNQEQVDFVEISGGNYEAPAMQGRGADEHTLAREAYFLTFAQQLQKVAQMPLMVTGGISNYSTASKVLASKVDLVGMASALAIQPDLPLWWQSRTEFKPKLPKVKLKDKTMTALATMATIRRHLSRHGHGKFSRPIHPVVSLVLDQMKLARLNKRYRKNYIDKAN
ncbi:NADH:flavin oxidoreductase/NADH oxidase family protein [Thalassotalea mangrovi]|uniref:NADH:flavin oxidoreductase/NADH oxidase family protein n=1 Tax=Thalassotalea mangrovi TaxID=2572245 RepID=A0A4U1B2C3_9GAMM|nr:NADH:flavin oxidoreductase/NADH oxidase family protein [Thalassotalea mangrovi]TKB43663.1 NADH:flavin oxidoreductase/NADH oxidase family protein [Thalassotalea mangrovi]